ncbi:hypothetical protein MKLM6_4453 (plasmid) [Methylomonas koyamae]|nr:hypothetical protein MKLM6_4453 [Methylomonas koyamae]
MKFLDTFARRTQPPRISVTPLWNQSVLSGSPKSNIRLLNPGLLFCLGLMSGFATPAKAAVTIDYSYDDLNRLQTVTRNDGPVVAYQYDVAGNFNTQGVTNSPDTDGDLLANFADPDDDNDGMPDAWEIQYGLNPLSPGDAGLDADGDGITNLAEYQANSNPLQPPNTSVAVPAVPEWGLVIMALALGLILARQTKKQGV